MTTDAPHSSPGDTPCSGAAQFRAPSQPGLPSTIARMPPSGPAPQKRQAAQAGELAGKVLIVDDNASSRRHLHLTLFSLGFDIGETASGQEALALCRIVPYDAVLLDSDKSGESGIRTCVELRRLRPHAVILMLSASDDQERMIEGLEAGADDYITKPFYMPELTARIRAKLRRARTTPSEPEQIIAIGDLTLHPAHRLVKKAGSTIRLSPKEFNLLHQLMAHPGLPITHERLLHDLWGAGYVGQVEYLRNFVRHLRKKLGDDAANPRYIRTNSCVGYCFADPAEWHQNGTCPP
jgi:two-component system KDP operon response regulator KdpE